MQQRVLALLRDVAAAGDRLRTAQRGGRIVRGAVRADASLLDELVERADRLLERRVGVLFVMLVEVDHVGLQALERRVERAQDVVARAATGRAVAHLLAELRRQHDLVAPAVEHAADDRLAAAGLPVDVGRVEERDAHLERRVDHGARRVFVDPAAEVVAAEADHRHPQSGGAQHAISHDLKPTRAGQTAAQAVRSASRSLTRAPVRSTALP